MRITLLVAALVVIGLSAARAATDATYMGGGQIVRVADEKFENIPAGAAVYIEHVDAEFGADFRSELARQKVALKIVSTPDEAQFLIVGSAKHMGGPFAESGCSKKGCVQSGWKTEEGDPLKGDRGQRVSQRV